MPAIHIDTIYESEAFRLLSRHMKDKHAVGIIYATMIADNGKDTLFRELESMADELLADEVEEKAPPLPVMVGDLTMRHIFTPIGVTDISNRHQQALWNRVEDVLVALEKALDDATGDARMSKSELMHITTTNKQTILDLEARLEQQEHYNKAAIARRDNKISALKAEVSALSDMAKERNLRLANVTHGLHSRLGFVHEKLFHDDPTDTEERVHRFLEEAIEVAHSVYVPLDEVIRLAQYVYQGKRGSLNEELSDAAITLASLCRHRERDFMTVVLDGLRKLESPERIERIRKKRANRKGRGALPGKIDTSGMIPKSVATETIAAPASLQGAVWDATIGDPEWTAPAPVHRAMDDAAPSFKQRKFGLSDLVRKKRGGPWRGSICGFYSTELTPIGYAVRSAFEPGSVQIYPEDALEPWNGK